MKKIVALVLSLVMVLGLATTAFGAAAKYAVWPATAEADDTDFTEAVSTNETALPTLTKAVAPVAPALNGTVAHYVCGFEGSSKTYVECSAAEADFYFTVQGKTTPVLYLKEMGSAAYLASAGEFTNFGKACGQVKITPAADTKYYTYTDADENVFIYAEDTNVNAEETATQFVLVGSKMVPVVTGTNYYGNLVPHTWVYSKNAAGVVDAAKCADCGATAAVYSTYTAVPVGADYVYEAPYYLVINAAPVVDTDKVESAQTFDAGIAMYVGMSVMAAAGSAVVLKKKD